MGDLLAEATEHEELRIKGRQLWVELAALMEVACAYAPTAEEINSHEERAKRWGLLFLECFSAADVTTYIHLFICHVHQFLHEYRSFGKFGNWAAEGLHSAVKYTVLHNSPRAGGKGAKAPAYYALKSHLIDAALAARGLTEPRKLTKKQMAEDAAAKH